MENLGQKEYDDSSNFLSLEGNLNSHVELNKGDFLVCYPEDAHMTGIKVDKKETIKKAIFKIKIK
ncbi:YhcH/YjgK/YiaL family protein [Romboutsia sp.]|uniref:YhcH/YjgK/YiaL family protein n=1 Tax=Romboutsia sp. TaxID=1965302 RepID=UPI003F2DACF8